MVEIIRQMLQAFIDAEPDQEKEYVLSNVFNIYLSFLVPDGIKSSINTFIKTAFILYNLKLH